MSTRRSLALVALGAATITTSFVAVAGPASAGLTGKCGSAETLSSPPDLTVGAVESNDVLHVVPEGQDVTLGSNLTVDAQAAGQYKNVSELADATIAHGTSVSSFLIHSDPVGASGQQTLSARVSFSSAILGVIATDAHLDASDTPLGLGSTIYPTGYTNRGVEMSQAAGTFTIEPDGKSLTFLVRTSSRIDQLRIVVAGNATGDTVNAGYRFADAAGSVYYFGNSPQPTPKDLPAAGVTHLNGAITQGVGTCSGRGFWLVGTDGGVFSFGDAQFFGSMGSTGTSSRTVAIARTNSDQGYWFVTAAGQVFRFGDANRYGDLPTLGITPAKPVRGMASTNTGKGYWLFAEDGGMFAFGDAPFYGSVPGLLGTTNIPSPVVGMAPTWTGKGYWMTTADGEVYGFGDAADKGSLRRLGIVPNKPIIGIRPSATGQGYVLIAQDGGVFAFGDATFSGSTGGSPPVRPVVAVLS